MIPNLTLRSHAAPRHRFRHRHHRRPHPRLITRWRLRRMPKRGQSKHLHDRSPSGLSPIRWLGSQRNPTSHAELGPSCAHACMVPQYSTTAHEYRSVHASRMGMAGGAELHDTIPGVCMWGLSIKGQGVFWVLFCCELVPSPQGAPVVISSWLPLKHMPGHCQGASWLP